MEIQKKKIKITDMQLALTKAQAYCAYQERCQQEMRDKLYEWGLHSEDVENIITELVLQNFINEERFAQIYTGGKFRIKKWGRIKIKQGLKQKKISDYCIKKAFKELEGDIYTETLKEVIEKKSKLLKEKHPLKRNYKLAQHAISKGFESDLVREVIKEFTEV
jgi:regulatory protein